MLKHNLLRTLMILSIFCSTPLLAGTERSHDYWGDLYQNESELRIEKKFDWKSKTYLELNDGSCWEIPQTIVKKAEGWFSSDIYGDPSKRWMRNDLLEMERARDGDCPVVFHNLETRERAGARQVNFALMLHKADEERFGEIQKELNELRAHLNNNAYWDNYFNDIIKRCYDDIRRLEGKLDRIERELDHKQTTGNTDKTRHPKSQKEDESRRRL